MYPNELAERDYYDELLSKGKGDPDTYGYPGEPRYIGDKPKVDHHYDPINRREINLDYDAYIDEDQEDNH